ncbi:MAG: oligosaccharide flippase family protein [Phycisphaerales bacterium]|nr:oligosaccharide flippase family protein [Phycisphaerales bacterium]
MALVRVVTQGLKMFSDIGIGPSIIRDEMGESPEFLNTAWTIQVIRGVGLFLGACVLAWPAAAVYEQPMLLRLLPACGFVAVIAGFNSTSLFTLGRRLDLGRATLRELATQVVSAAVMIGLAFYWKSVWTLVIGWYVAGLTTLLISHRLVPGYRVGFGWDPESARRLVSFGKWIFVSTLIAFVAGQMDRLLLGRLLSLSELGVYSVALTALMVPVAVCQRLAHTVLFPVLASHVRDDPRRLGRSVWRAREIVLPVSLAALLAVIAGAPVLFGYLYDDRYEAAGWIAQLLAIPTWFTLLQSSADRAVLAAGSSRSLATSGLVKLLVTGGCAAAGYIAWGLPGFIGGMGAGAVAGYLSLQAALRQHDVHVIRQDAGYTGLALLLGVATAMAPRVGQVRLADTPRLETLLITACAVLLPVGAWSAWKVRGALRGKRVSGLSGASSAPGVA